MSSDTAIDAAFADRIARLEVGIAEVIDYWEERKDWVVAEGPTLAERMVQKLEELLA